MNPESFLANSVGQQLPVGRVMRDSIMNKGHSSCLVEWALLPEYVPLAEIVGGAAL
jgi:hypothetical protein